MFSWLSLGAAELFSEAEGVKTLMLNFEIGIVEA